MNVLDKFNIAHSTRVCIESKWVVKTKKMTIPGTVQVKLVTFIYSEIHLCYQIWICFYVVCGAESPPKSNLIEHWQFVMLFNIVEYSMHIY